MKKKCLVLFSGGLDSRLVVKIMQEQGFKIIGRFFNLPFVKKYEEKSAKEFARKHKFKLKIIDCTKGKLLEDYLKMLRKPKHGRGAGFNPCIDCRIFILKEAKKFAKRKNIDIIATGDVLDERPMSQKKKTMELIDRELGLQGKILRPLSAKLLSKTKAEEKDLIKREKMYSISGRRRVHQINLAKKFKIDYPTPAGGCLLCEKALIRRFKELVQRKEKEKYLELMNVGKHYLIKEHWIVFGRNEQENKIIEKIGKNKRLIIPDYPGPTALIMYGKINKKILDKANKMIFVHSKKGKEKDKKGLEKYKI